MRDAAPAAPGSTRPGLAQHAADQTAAAGEPAHPRSSEQIYRVAHSELRFDGPIFAVRRDEISTPTGSASRDVVENFSAVAVAPVRDGQVLLLRQYRHAHGRYFWEIPAGLLDAVGEDPLFAAQRELAEETGLQASDWSLLGDLATSPGFSEEMVRIYRAEGLAPDSQADARAEPRDEEADLELRWLDVEEAVSWVQSGAIDNAIAVAAIMHVARGTRRGVDEPFRYHSGLAARRTQAQDARSGSDLKGLR